MRTPPFTHHHRVIAMSAAPSSVDRRLALGLTISLPRTWRFTRSLPPAPPPADRPADAAPDCKAVRALAPEGRCAITKDGRAPIATLPARRIARLARIALRRRGAMGRVQTIAAPRVTAGRTAGFAARRPAASSRVAAP